MRKTLLFLLLASATAPAIASIADDDRKSERSRRADRIDDGEDSRAQQPQRSARIERDDDDRRSMRLERRERLSEQLIDRRQRRANDSASAPALQGGSADSVRRWRARERLRADSPAVVEERNLSGGERLRNALVQRQAPAVSRVPRAGTQPPERTGARALHNGLQQWSTTWRSDRRYDWRNHRNRYGSLFNFGFYHDPFGWGYRPFAIGWRMWPSYYSRSYWLNDPWQYRLPYAPPGYRWIRYYDDAILVDTWDGRVVDVIHHFFW